MDFNNWRPFDTIAAMKVSWVLGLAVLAIVCGCGGMNAGGRYRGTTEFVGSWSGTWQNEALATAGGLSCIIDNTADMVGTLQDDALGLGELDGWIDTDGETEGTVIFPGGQHFRYEGSLIRTDSSMTGNIFFKDNATHVTSRYLVNLTLN